MKKRELSQVHEEVGSKEFLVSSGECESSGSCKVSSGFSALSMVPLHLMNA